MNPDDPNIQQLVTIAHALGDLRNQVVLVGGCAVGLLITDDARPAVRATIDIDLVLEVATTADYYAFSEQLRAKNFYEDPTDDVMCRWRYNNMIVDVMPTEETILGFSNRWYRGIEKQSISIALPDGTNILVASAPLFLATKLEAFGHRGKGDFGASHDIEDIVNLIDGRQEIIEEIEASDGELKAYLREEIEYLLSETSFVDYVPYHLLGDDISQQRTPEIINRFRRIAGL